MRKGGKGGGGREKQGDIQGYKAWRGVGVEGVIK